MSYLEEFVSSINYLPGEVSRSLELIKFLDEKVKSCTEQFSFQSSEYFSGLHKDTGVCTENLDLLQKIRKNHQSALGLSDEKISIIKQMLDIVDFHTTQLKLDLDAKKPDICSDTGNKENKPRKKQKVEESNGLPLDMSMSMIMENGMQEGLEMQVDQNNTYCYCNSGSYGEMIECEGIKVRLM